MLAQYFHADTNKNKSAKDFYFVLEKMPEFLADHSSGIGKCECYKAYDCYRHSNGAGY